METGKVVLGTLAGIAIGAVVGLLLAPDKGSETRRKLSEKGTDYADDLKDKYSGLKNKYNDLVDGVTNKLESFTDGASETSSRIANQNPSSQARTASAGTGGTI